MANYDVAYLLHAVPGHGAGEPAKALAGGDSAAGFVAVVTGGDTVAGTLVEVLFDVDDVLDLTWSVTAVTSDSLGGDISGTSVVSTDTGFSVVTTGVPATGTFYLFTYSS